MISTESILYYDHTSSIRDNLKYSVKEIESFISGIRKDLSFPATDEELKGLDRWVDKLTTMKTVGKQILDKTEDLDLYIRKFLEITKTKENEPS